MSGLGTKLTRMLVIGALSITSLVVTAPLAQSATVLQDQGTSSLLVAFFQHALDNVEAEY